MGIALIILLLICLMWPLIVKWLRALAMRKMEDVLRKAAGAPPREKRGSRRDYGDAGRNWSERQSAYSGYGRSQRTRRGNDDGPIIPREYAEDVDFVEVREFSETKIGAESRTSFGRRRNRYEESQVSDAVWEMVKPGKRKK